MMRATSLGFVLTTALLLSSASVQVCRAESKPAQDKSRFTLFNPTPKALMREMATDRPDTTEAPYTVDAGHVQVELSFFDYVRDDRGGDRTDAWTILPSNLKIGLLNNVDLQLVIEPYVNVRTRTAPGQSRRDHGFGNMQIRTKFNLWGNDSGDTAFAIMPYVQFPTADDAFSTDHLEGGIVMPLLIELPHGFTMTVMGELDFLRDQANEGYGVEFLHTVSISRQISGPLGGYIEYIGIAPNDTGRTYTAALGMGLTYAISDDIQLDGGVNIGLSESAEDLNFFLGLSFRI